MLKRREDAAHSAFVRLYEWEQRPSGEDGVIAHHRPFFLREVCVIVQDIQGNVELPHVVIERAQAELGQLMPSQAETLSKSDREHADVDHVVERVVVVLLDGSHAREENPLPSS